MTAPTADKALQEELELREKLVGNRGSDTFRINYLIEAGAGAGKSFTMTNRIVNLLLAEEDGTPFCAPEQLVAITFTVKATQELQSKLEREFRDRLKKAEAAEDAAETAADKAAAAAQTQKLRALAERVDQIQVSTIDSFCRKLLTTMPFANPLGLSGVMESDEQKLARDFFARRRRERVAVYRVVEDRFALKFSSLESAFLRCCGKGDFQLSFPPMNDPDVRKIEDVVLPARALALIEGIRTAVKDYPMLKDMLHPEMTALLARPDADFGAGRDGLAALIRFYGGHPKAVGGAYNAVLMEAAWEAYYGRYAAFFAAIGTKSHPGILTPIQGAPARLPTDECQTALDKLSALIAGESYAADWLADDLLALEKDCRGATFSEDPLSDGGRKQAAFRGYFSKHKTPKSIKKADLSAGTAAKQINASWKPKIAGPGKKNADDPDSFGVQLRYVLHRDVMNLLEPDVQAYRREKLQLSTATFNDVLVMARDMLKNSADARAYFHERYRCFYVDEFQDTDAIQTELLFYLACRDGKDPNGEDFFHAGDWERCVPRAGSLFLVGDPKQGIYRFRGADVGVYDQVRKRFRRAPEKTEEVHVLHFNFRSTKEICDFSRRAFKPDKDKEGYPVLEGTDYQADYEDMTGVCRDADGRIVARGAEPLSRIIPYTPGMGAASDPVCVASFIQAMIENQVTLPARGNDPAPRAGAGDFMILTGKKEDANAYARELRRRGIKARLSGLERFDRTAPIAASVRWLHYLLEPEDPLCILNVLHRCYGVKLQDVRRLLMRAREADPAQTDARKKRRPADLPALFRPAEPNKPAKRLDALAAALLAEDPRDDALCALCAALEEMWQMRRAVRTLPAVAAMERLFGTVGCLWPENGTQSERSVDYARVQQFLDLLRKERERSFADLARRALELAEEEVEDELALTREKDCVQVMNLHKAKGLEAEIVILAESKKADFEPTEYRETVGKAQRLHLCVTVKPKGRKAKTGVIGQELQWGAHAEEEKNYSDAERCRLLYVAATRAKSMLLINEKCFRKPAVNYWEPLGLAADDLCAEEREAEAEAKAAAQKAWEGEVTAALAAGSPIPDPPAFRMPEDETLRFRAALESLERGAAIGWEEYKAALSAELEQQKQNYYAVIAAAMGTAPDGGDGQDDDDAQADGDAQTDGDAQAGADAQAAGPAPTPVDFAARTAALQSEMEARAESERYVITPSGLDKRGHGAGKAAQRKARDGDEDDAAEPDDDAATAALPPEDGESDESLLPDAGAEDEDADAGEMPRGKHWGTILHRILELAVRSGKFDGADIAAFARQAAFETLDDAALSPTERRYLCCGDAEGEALVDAVAAAAAKAAAFLEQPGGALRKLLAEAKATGGQCYTELPFFLRAADRNSPVYRHLAGHIKSEAAKDKILDANGIIDLAVLHGDGSWTVVDYKTDCLRRGETPEKLAARLEAEYTGQVAAYCRVLELHSGARIRRACLCSVPLGGTLIELDPES